MPRLAEIAAYLDDELQVSVIPDHAGALNGVQLENRGEIARVATAVDFCAYTARAAVAANAQLLVVHHGMFWSGVRPMTDHHYERLRELITHDVAVYSAHIPLDVHPVLGNNVLLAQILGLRPSGGFARFQDIDVGLSGESEVPTASLIERMETFAAGYGGSVVVQPVPADRMTRRWGMCTGAGASSSTLAEARERGIDTMIVGEGSHHTGVEARDLGITVIYAGHYATETLGVRAVGDRLAARFDVQTTFIDAPTGL